MIFRLSSSAMAASCKANFGGFDVIIVPSSIHFKHVVSNAAWCVNAKWTGRASAAVLRDMPQNP